jgi:hypothetical protein
MPMDGNLLVLQGIGDVDDQSVARASLDGWAREESFNISLVIE